MKSESPFEFESTSHGPGTQNASLAAPPSPQGNSELAQAAERPDHFSFFGVVLLLVGAATLLYYDWGSRS